MALIRVAFVLQALGLVACTNYFHQYESSHPGWKLAFPRKGMPLDELVASVFAPRQYAPYGDGHVKTVLIFDRSIDPPEQISLSALESGEFEPDPSGDYLVGVRVSCTAPSQDAAWIGEGFFWYLLDENELVAYQQTSFYMLCYPTEPKSLAPERFTAEEQEWLRRCLTRRCS